MPKGSYEKFNTPRARISPTTLQLAWAAGIFEGEGTAHTCNGTHRTLNFRVPQKDPWLLFKLQEMFGGKVSLRRPSYMFVWDVSGRRARGVAMTLYSFLSPRRREQIRVALSRETLKVREM